MTESSQSYEPGRFCWNELETTDVPGAEAFYSALFGWTTEAFGRESDYTLFRKGTDGVGGLMKCPEPGMPPFWLAYVSVDDVDATITKAKQLGGKLVYGPEDVKTVGRIAVLLDPQGAAIAVIRPVPQGG